MASIFVAWSNSAETCLELELEHHQESMVHAATGPQYSDQSAIKMILPKANFYRHSQSSYMRIRVQAFVL